MCLLTIVNVRFSYMYCIQTSMNQQNNGNWTDLECYAGNLAPRPLPCRFQCYISTSLSLIASMHMHALLDYNYNTGNKAELISILWSKFNVQPLQGRDKRMLYHNHWKFVNFKFLNNCCPGSIEFHFLVSAKKAETFLDQISKEHSPCFLIQILLYSSVDSLHDGIISLSRDRLLIGNLVKKTLQAIIGLETSWGGIGNAEEGAHTKKEDDGLHCLVVEE